MSSQDASAGGARMDTAVESVFLLAILAWAIYVLTESLGFGAYFAWVMPLVVAVPLLAVAVLQLASLHSSAVRGVVARVRLDESSNVDDADPISSGRDVALFVGLTIVYVVIAALVGFFIAMPIFLFTFFQAYGSFHWKRSLAITVAVWVTVSFVFGTVFAVPGVDFGPFSVFELDLF